jgi:hypothetical protein
MLNLAGGQKDSKLGGKEGRMRATEVVVCWGIQEKPVTLETLSLTKFMK